jgi:hypothetical protein
MKKKTARQRLLAAFRKMPWSKERLAWMRAELEKLTDEEAAELLAILS